MNPEQNPYENTTLQTMTTAMRWFKQLLQSIESQYRSTANTGDTQTLKAQQIYTNFVQCLNQVQQNSSNRMLATRFVSRLAEIATFLRNKIQPNDGMDTLRDQLNAIVGGIKDYQSISGNWMGYSSLNTLQTNHKQALSLAFQKIQAGIRRCLDQLNNRHLNYLSQMNKSPANATTKPYTTLSSTPIRRQKPGKDRRPEEADTPILKSLEYKHKLTKEVIGTAGLLVGMDVDLTYLRSMLFQGRNNPGEVHENKMEENQQIARDRQGYSGGFSEYRSRQKIKKYKKEKAMAKSKNNSPTKRTHNAENKQSQPHNGKSSLIATSPSMPKYGKSTQLGQQQGRRGNSKNPQPQAQAAHYNRQLIFLSQIKNRSIAKRPYAEIKQVLVAGDELNFYSNKGTAAEGGGSKNRTSFFIQKNSKNDKYVIRKKSLLGAERIVTQQ